MHPTIKVMKFDHLFREKTLDNSFGFAKKTTRDKGIAIRKGDTFVIPPNPKLIPEYRYFFFDKK